MWGKYAGTKFGDIPTQYLQWFVKNSYPQMANRREWAIQELKRRNIDIPNHKKPHTLSKPNKNFV